MTVHRQDATSELRASAEALRRSEARYRMLADHADDIVALYGLDSVLIYASPSSERITGWTSGDLIGRNRTDIIHSDDMPAAIRSSETLHRTGKSLLEWRCLRKDGTYVWLETRAKLILEDGTPTHIMSVSRDISRQREVEDALQRSQERFGSLIQHAAYGIYLSTPDGRFLEVNQALVAMLGYDSVEELMALDLGRDVYQDPSERAELRRRAEISEQASEWVEVHWRRKDGTPLTAQLSVNTVRDASGEVLFFEGIAEDVTERRRREEAGRRSERMASLGTMLAGVAHELNNPLAAISGFAQIMLRGDRPPDDLSALETIHHEATRAAKIVKDLLTFARRQDSEARDFIDLNAIVGYIASTRRYTLETRGIHVTLELAPALPLVLGDRTQLEQVVLNLIVNAEHALAQTVDAPADGRSGHRTDLTLRTSSQEGFVVLEIADTGPGISPNDLPRIWDPFWTTKSEGEGTGLGLPVVHGIVATHGGSIDVKSEAGVGTTFTVRLPAAAASDEAKPAAPARNAKAPAAAKPLDILVIDDEPSIVRFLESYLTSRGHAVMIATDGQTAVQLGDRSDFDVVVCDMRMPGMDGPAVIEKLRAMPHMKRSRYIISTGNVDSPETKARIDALMPSAVLAKPYKMEELRRLIEDS